MTRAALALAALGSVIAGGVLHLAGRETAGDVLWAATVAVMLVPLTWSVARSLLHGDVGVDAIALVSMAGALALGQYLAGAVVALMLAGGRARRELSKLVERMPRIAHVRRGSDVIEVPVDDVSVGDVVIVRAGEV